MSKRHIVPITNGMGSKGIINGTYDVTAEVLGYDNNSLTPTTQEITEGVIEYSFTIATTGTLTLHVSDDGTSVGIPIVGAKFYRTDNTGKTYGTVITTDDQGFATFNYVPFSTTQTPPNVYFKQIESDGEHNFDNSVKSVQLENQLKTIEIKNEEATTRTIKLTDESYEGLPIDDGNVIFIEQ